MIVFQNIAMNTELNNLSQGTKCDALGSLWYFLLVKLVIKCIDNIVQCVYVSFSVHQTFVFVDIN